MTQQQDQEGFQIIDEGNDRRYFSQIPHIVHMMGLSVYAFRLYAYIKYRTGENGRCWENCKNIAENCCMSDGSVTKAKKELQQLGLISVRYGTVSRGKASHIISITDIWAANILIMASSDPKGKAEKFAMTNKADYEVQISCGEIITSCGEINKNQVNKNPVPLSHSLSAEKPQIETDEKSAKKPAKKYSMDKQGSAPYKDVVDLEKVFAGARGYSYPPPSFEDNWAMRVKRWKKPLKEVLLLCEGDVTFASKIIRECVSEQMEKNFHFDAPDGIIKMARSKVVDLKRQSSTITATKDGGGFYV